MKMKNKFLMGLSMSVVLATSFSISTQSIAEEMPKDTRIMVDVKTEWKDHLLHDMRFGLLPTVTKVIAAASKNDMKTVAKEARARGMGHMQKMNMDMMAVLPMPMKGIGKSMHMGFDEVAKSADAGESTAQVMGKLSKVLDSCNACHATYRLN